jgi:shikimate dehydrogenase
MKNVALIGMPGCGKTSAGRELARLTGRELLDMDGEIEKRAGCTIPEIFNKEGEDAFRALETQVLSDFSKMSGVIISTGGGVVTRPENRRLLRQNSTVVFLDRKDISSLAKTGGPYPKRSPRRRFTASACPCTGAGATSPWSA